MNEVDSNSSNKITIKIRHSDDEDYHDISIDWSNESFDYRKQLFHQLSAYTGIPLEYQEYVEVQNGNIRRDAGLLNAELKDKRLIAEWAWIFDTKENAMGAIHDGDCFLLQTSIMVFDRYNGVYCQYYLINRDLVNETGCNLRYCHYLGSRFFTNKFLALTKSEYLQRIFSIDYDGQTHEDLLRSLNIDHLQHLKCNVAFSVYPDLRKWWCKSYLRHRG